MDEVETLIKNRELIDDIDKDDVENPQLVVEYVNEIYAYLRQFNLLQETLYLTVAILDRFFTRPHFGQIGHGIDFSQLQIYSLEAF